MKAGAIIAAAVAVVAIAFGIYMIDVDVSGDVELPEVEVTGGEMPEVDAEVGSIETGTEEVTVEVPTIEVNPPAEDGERVETN